MPGRCRHASEAILNWTALLGALRDCGVDHVVIAGLTDAVHPTSGLWSTWRMQQGRILSRRRQLRDVYERLVQKTCRGACHGGRETPKVRPGNAGERPSHARLAVCRCRRSRDPSRRFRASGLIRLLRLHSESIRLVARGQRVHRRQPGNHELGLSGENRSGHRSGCGGMCCAAGCVCRHNGRPSAAAVSTTGSPPWQDGDAVGGTASRPAPRAARV